MFGRFLPQTRDFFDYFERHAAVIGAAGRRLDAMVTAQTAEHRAAAAAIAALEKDADAIAHECIKALHQTFITPFDRDDIYRLIKHLDDILDAIEEVAARLALYKVSMAPSQVGALVKVLLRAIEEVQNLIGGWRRGAAVEALQGALGRIHSLENEGDVMMRHAVGGLFEREDPMYVLKWKEIYEGIEDAIDCCKAVGDIVEGVIIENS